MNQTTTNPSTAAELPAAAIAKLLEEIRELVAQHDYVLCDVEERCTLMDASDLKREMPIVRTLLGSTTDLPEQVSDRLGRIRELLGLPLDECGEIKDTEEAET